MRTIKFRGRDFTGTWWKGDLLHKGDNTLISPMPGMKVYVEPETVGQYTDWKDRNGKEIYESDILDSEYFQIPKFHPLGLCEVRWDTDGWECRTPFDNSCTLYTAVASYGAEVIGNIHDNPILLKGGER